MRNSRNTRKIIIRACAALAALCICLLTPGAVSADEEAKPVDPLDQLFEVQKKAQEAQQNFLQELAAREWYRQKKDEQLEKREASSEADLSSFKKSASEEIESVLVLLGEAPLGEKKALYGPVFISDKQGIFGSDTDFSFKWVGYKLSMGFKHKKTPWSRTTLSETVVGSFLYASGTNIGFAGGKAVEERRFYTNYGSEIVSLKVQTPYRTAVTFSLDSRQYFFVKRDAPEDFNMPDNHVNVFPRIDLALEQLKEKGIDQLTHGVGLEGWAGYGIRSKWEPWGEPGEHQSGSFARTFWIYSGTLTLGWLGASDQNLVLRARYKGGDDNDFLTRPRFGGSIDNAKIDVVHGTTVDQFRVESFALVNGRFSFNIFSRLRMNLFLDYARIIAPDGQDVAGAGYGFRLLAWGGLPIWIAHGVSKRYFSDSKIPEQVVTFMTAAGW
ncbi:MAG: hypothetical protein EPN93_11365 [Spirochaetes bacterium]|nr:MAG: hypothetical protein EPN93_11365 [Spirochaetota bacterium]